MVHLLVLKMLQEQFYLVQVLLSLKVQVQTLMKQLGHLQTRQADRVISIPNATDTLIGKATTDTLTNKTFDLGGTGNTLTGSLSEFN